MSNLRSNTKYFGSDFLIAIQDQDWSLIFIHAFVNLKIQNKCLLNKLLIRLINMLVRM